MTDHLPRIAVRLRRLLETSTTAPHIDISPPASERERAERMAAACGLALQYEHWMIFAGRLGGFWAGVREAHTPIGCLPTLQADTAGELDVLLAEQERLRGRGRQQ